MRVDLTYSRWLSTCLEQIFHRHDHSCIVHSRIVRPCHMVPHCPLLQCPPLPHRADLSTPTNSIPAIWCRIVHSCFVHSRKFSVPIGRWLLCYEGRKFWANCPCNYFPRFSTYVVLIHQRHRRTDRQTDDMQAQYASRGKNCRKSGQVLEYTQSADCGSDFCCAESVME